MPRALVDITGMRFGRLFVIHRVPNKGPSKWLTLCDCGRESIKCGHGMRVGKLLSCGCLLAEKAGARWRTHGESHSKTHMVWCSMRSRCNNPNSEFYHVYGGKGIKVCERWNSYENFIADMGHAPAGMQIERLDSNKGYSPDNCVWATPMQNANNTSRNLNIDYCGKTQSLAMWCRELGVGYKVVQQRIGKLGWPVVKAFETPVRRSSHAHL